jgi:hypothetical protein
MIGKRDVFHGANKTRIVDQLYKCSQTEYPDLFEPLILTGGHSILVNQFTSKEQRAQVVEVLNTIYATDKKCRLPVCVDERSTVYEIPGNYTVYHIALQNNDCNMNYGIFANGLLVESCSKKYMTENMTLIE